MRQIALTGLGHPRRSPTSYRVQLQRGDDDAFGRIYGIDSDPSADDLAVINMILNRDGQANLWLEDSIEHHTRWAEEMDVVLCNPPFGASTVEKRAEVLEAYDLRHQWQHRLASDRVGASSQGSGVMAAHHP